MMRDKVINFEEKLAKITDQRSPKIMVQLNDCHFKLVKLQGDFVRHSHSETGEAFLVIEGEMFIDFRDGAAKLEKGELPVVPKGVEHKRRAEEECRVMLLEPAGTPNTGDAGGDRTVENPKWI